MNASDSSAIARKLRNFYVTQHQATPRARNWSAEELKEEEPESKAGILRHAAMVTLMGIAVLLTEASLILIKWVRRIEESA